MLIDRVLAADELAQPVKDLINNKIAPQIIDPLIQLGFAVALMYFLWGIYMFIKDAASDKRKERQLHLIYGVLGLTIMVSVWGILSFICTNVGCK